MKIELSAQFLLGCFFLILLIAIPFFPLSTYDFIGYDDDSYVLQNPHVTTGITFQNIYWAFTSGHSANWHPLTWISHMLDCALFGIKAGAHHWMNLNFHILNTLLLFFILHGLTQSIQRSFIVAALFGIHPLHVESVAWIAERKDVLSTCMALISMGAYIRYVDQKGRIPYVCAILFFALSLMGKPMMVTLPFLLLLLDFWPLSRMHLKKRVLLLEKIPFFILTFLSCGITIWAQQTYGAVQSLASLPFFIRVENALAAYGWYVLKTIVPTNLSIFYPHPETHLPFITIAWGVSVIVLGVWCSWRFRDSHPYILVGFFWFMGTLIPVIGLVQVGLQAYADRYSYVPLIGLFIAFTWAFCDFMSELKMGKKIASGILAGIITIFTVMCTTQVHIWKNGTRVFEHASQVIPDNFVAMTHLGTIPHLKTAVSIQPNYIPALYNLGTVLIQKGKIDEALTYYLRAVHLKANHPDLYNNLGAIYYQRKQYDLARSYFQKALEISPFHNNARRNVEQVNRMVQGQDRLP
ncbi:MAG: tetratricopeptide repeat protein [Candidatus Magnetomorum sp.]|nr:tetratricopeptide repeat protein [Candidatus Magnetomorum sp.]